MVEDDITIHPQNSLNSGYQGYTKPFLYLTNFFFSNTMIIFVPQIKNSDHTIDR